LMPTSRLRFTVSEWMVIVAVSALVLARSTWVLRHEGPDRLHGEGVLCLAIAGATVIWFQIRPIRAGRKGAQRPRPSSYTPSKSMAPGQRKG
jgi:hypothetical protein